jgi:predicted solute-binding protein
LFGGRSFSSDINQRDKWALAPEEKSYSRFAQPTVTKLRISVVQYLNTAPLIRGFTHGPQGDLATKRYDLSFTVPSQCAEALRTGAADIAIIPAIEYQRIVSQGIPLTILPDLAIASKERVRSLLLISKVPIRQARRIALDPSSRSTQALTKILAAKRWQISPEFFEPPPPAIANENGADRSAANGANVDTGIAAMLANADAALIIGDAALRIAIAAEAHGVKPGLDGEWLASADSLNSLVAAQYIAPAERLREASSVVSAALRAVPQIHIYDIVKEWRHLTELPAVLAIWAARSNPAHPELIKDVPIKDIAADFQASRDFGLTQIRQIAAEAAREMHLPEKELRLYLEKNIDYSLHAENLQGLQRFFHESQSLGLIAPLQPINIAGSTAIIAARSL